MHRLLLRVKGLGALGRGGFTFQHVRRHVTHKDTRRRRIKGGAWPAGDWRLATGDLLSPSTKPLSLVLVLVLRTWMAFLSAEYEMAQPQPGSWYGGTGSWPHILCSSRSGAVGAVGAVRRGPSDTVETTSPPAGTNEQGPGPGPGLEESWSKAKNLSSSSAQIELIAAGFVRRTFR